MIPFFYVQHWGSIWPHLEFLKMQKPHLLWNQPDIRDLTEIMARKMPSAISQKERLFLSGTIPGLLYCSVGLGIATYLNKSGPVWFSQKQWSLWNWINKKCGKEQHKIRTDLIIVSQRTLSRTQRPNILKHFPSIHLTNIKYLRSL